MQKAPLFFTYLSPPPSKRPLGSHSSSLLPRACVVVTMEEYQNLDPYSRSRYEHGIDSKIVIMGNSGTLFIHSAIPLFGRLLAITGVGKTSLLHRYTQNKFDPKNTTSTSGAFFVTKKVYVNGLKVRLQLWDTAGQERFRSMVSSFDVNADHILSHFFFPPPQAPMYYRGSSAARATS